MRRILLFALLLATPALAETPLTAEEFEAATQGRTMTFSVEGEAYGIERYMDDRQVLWSFLDGECTAGRWYPQGDQICFVYDWSPDDTQCWTIYDEGSRLRAVFMNEPDTDFLYEAMEDEHEMICNFGA